MKNLQQIIGVYNSAISSDIAFETNNAIINIILQHMGALNETVCKTTQTTKRNLYTTSR